jgi:uncharacterized membrane protein YdjX (TVP38/TMEM64 family)
MYELFRTLPLMCVVLLAPIIPFLLWGGSFEEWLRGLAEDPPPPGVLDALVVGLLSTDIFLPIPSSVVSTMAGWQLGWLRGTLATWVGLSVGAVAGFALARQFGRRLALWFSRAEDLDRMHELSQEFGPYVLAITRAVPVFSEATVLLMGAHQLSWSRFLPAVLASNLGIALAYAAFGDFAQQHQWLPLALGVSIALPVLVAAVAQRWFARRERPGAKP